MPNPRAESIFRNEVNYKGEPIPKDAVPKGRPKPKKKFDWEKEKRRLKYPRQWPRGEGQP